MMVTLAGSQGVAQGPTKCLTACQLKYQPLLRACGTNTTCLATVLAQLEDCVEACPF